MNYNFVRGKYPKQQKKEANVDKYLFIATRFHI